MPARRVAKRVVRRVRPEDAEAIHALLEACGLHVSGTSPDGELVEYVELDRALHPYYVATQAHPELKSRPTKAHPLFRGLLRASVERMRSQRLFSEDV